MNDAGMEQRLRRGVATATLGAYYGGLLTQKQRTALRLHYEEDWSLGEIADELQVSRQNVHELITRSEEKLARYEKLLGCAKRDEERQQRLKAARDALAEALDALGGVDASEAASAARRAQDAIIEMISHEEGEDEPHGI